jgi:hypothetical protein
MKIMWRAMIVATLTTSVGSSHAQDKPDNAAPAGVTVNVSKNASVVAKDVRDIIGFGGRITVKDSQAKVLGGAAGDVETVNANFDTVILAAGSVDMKGGVVGELKIAAGRIDLNISRVAKSHSVTTWTYRAIWTSWAAPSTQRGVTAAT